MIKDPNDKYAEYAVDFNGLVTHTEEEVEENDASVSDWHQRHSDRLLEEFCAAHPSAPQCKVFDE